MLIRSCLLSTYRIPFLWQSHGLSSLIWRASSRCWHNCNQTRGVTEIAVIYYQKRLEYLCFSKKRRIDGTLLFAGSYFGDFNLHVKSALFTSSSNYCFTVLKVRLWLPHLCLFCCLLLQTHSTVFCYTSDHPLTNFAWKNEYQDHLQVLHKFTKDFDYYLRKIEIHVVLVDSGPCL